MDRPAKIIAVKDITSRAILKTSERLDRCPAASAAPRAGGSIGYRRITGPITTVRDGHKLPKVAAVTRFGVFAWGWFSERTWSSTVVLGNHTCSVRHLTNMKLGEITQPLVELLRDAEQAENYLDGHDSPFFRRAYIRSTMAAIEAIVWFLKQTCVKAAAGSQSQLSVAEYSLLSDKTYDLKNNGEVNVQTKFLKLPDNVRFAIKTCNRLFGTTVDLQVGST